MPRAPVPGASAAAVAARPDDVLAPFRKPIWGRAATALAVAVLLTLHVVLAVRSLVLENPTIDEVIHLPAGITYWQKGTFRFYHQNPPLIKLLAALPVLASPELVVNYPSSSWSEVPNKTAFAHQFMSDNAANYFELFTRARLVMPLFSVIGGLVVFFWAARLYGAGGGLLSLALWVFCPNILAHCRLVTTDVGATSLGVFATFLFWLYLKRPSWARVVAAGFALGLAQLSKFSLILLYGLWPILGLLELLMSRERTARARRVLRRAVQMAAMIAISIAVIDAGYAFERVGIPLSRFEFVSAMLTRPVPPGMWRPSSEDRLINAAHQYRVNRFRGTWLGRVPVPLPAHYLLGFDSQKLEAEGIPQKFIDPGAVGEEILGYSVFLDGTLQQKSWWYYYLLAMVYKIPEGTWALGIASLVVLAAAPRVRASWFDEIMVLTIPVVVLGVMSVFTNINIGLRYVLPILPYLFISTGKLVPWAAGLTTIGKRWAARLFVAAGLAATVAGSLLVAPHYLAYFNALSGGPRNGSAHLIDSNLDWGQDLVGLRRWIRDHAKGERIGLAYFGQINPNIFQFRQEGGFPWFLPPPLPDTMKASDLPSSYWKKRPEPGLYAVSASLVRGLPWHVYENELPRWAPRYGGMNAFRYFQELTPIDQIGESILIYRVTPADSAKLARYWERGKTAAN